MFPAIDERPENFTLGKTARQLRPPGSRLLLNVFAEIDTDPGVEKEFVDRPVGVVFIFDIPQKEVDDCVVLFFR